MATKTTSKRKKPAAKAKPASSKAKTASAKKTISQGAYDDYSLLAQVLAFFFTILCVIFAAMAYYAYS